MSKFAVFKMDKMTPSKLSGTHRSVNVTFRMVKSALMYAVPSGGKIAWVGVEVVLALVEGLVVGVGTGGK